MEAYLKAEQDLKSRKKSVKIHERTWRIQKHSFIPERYSNCESPSDFTYHDKASSLIRVDFTGRAPDKNTIVVAVEEAHAHNETREVTVSSFGVYFSPDSVLNMYGLISQHNEETHPREYCLLYAVMQAMVIIRDNKTLLSFRDLPSRKTIVIQTTSSHLQRCFTEWFNEWEANPEIPASQKQLMAEIHHVMDELADLYMEVRFWEVDCMNNIKAQDLANLALEMDHVDEIRAAKQLLSFSGSSTSQSETSTLPSVPHKTDSEVYNRLMNRFLDSKIEITLRDLLSLHPDPDVAGRMVEQAIGANTEGPDMSFAGIRG
ncbi:hypothetical protein ACMFMG_002628 [Clarireedia jacksonii]